MRVLIAFAVLALPMAALAAAPANPEDKAETAAGPGDKMVCKRFLKTGSLVDGYRTCKPKREWERDRENRRTMNVANSCASWAEGGFC